MYAREGFRRSLAGVARLLFTFAVAVQLLGLASAHAQTTTISGTVYDPRTTTASLPLPNVLVYATTGTVDPLPSGVQCITSDNSTPTGAVSYTYTAVDGTFTLTDIPENTTLTVVIQAGKWRRQFTEAIDTTALTGLSLHMPSDRTQGDIPMIAIATGSVDGAECVLLHMGIAQTEFTDDTGSTNSGGHIHLYQGTGSPGAEISASTPRESALTGSSTTLNGYDMVMFPCQGNEYLQANSPLTNLVDFANAGGRIFGTHYSYVYLDSDSPYNAQFPSVANWTAGNAEHQITSGIGTVSTSFTDGATLAQWLQNSGATVTGTANQIKIGDLRTDAASVIAPTQSWVTLNSGTYTGQTGNPVMQMTFNAPVGAASSSQCGRVMFNDYHVITPTGNRTFPSECPAESTMTAQEEMLEYALFDLSSFVTPVVVPTLSIVFNPSPLSVKPGDTAAQVTVSVTNTSSTTVVYASTVLTLTLPAGMTATALTDSTGGWICTVGTLTCTRTTSLAAGATDAITLTASVATYSAATPTTKQITATASSPNFSSNVTATDDVIFAGTPTITWPTPANIIYGTALSATQLDATASVPGAFSYSPAAGTVLSTGQHTLAATFTPTDTTSYTTATATVTLTVIPATSTLTLTSNVNPVFAANAVTFTATIPSYLSGTLPTGTITFYDGTTQIGSAAVANASATYTTTALTSGTHAITAAYSGDSSYGSATSAALSQQVIDFTIAPSGSGKLTAAAASTASFPLVITPVGGTAMPSAITLAVAGLPLGATGTFSPAQVAQGAGTTTVTLAVQLPGSAAVNPGPKPFGGGALPLALSLVLLPFAGRLRKAWKQLAVLALMALALTMGMSGCGGGGKLKGNSYTLTVTATSGGLSHTTSLTLSIE